MATPNVERTIGPGTRVDLSISGALPIYLPDNVFRESLTNELLMQGLTPITVSVRSAYGLTSRDYTASVSVKPLAQSRVSAIVGQVRSALERAGSYSPVITVPAIGDPAQQAVTPSVVESAVNQIINAVGTATQNVADAPKDLFRGINVLAIGIVVIVALVAFGPNVKAIARSAR